MTLKLITIVLTLSLFYVSEGQLSGNQRRGDVCPDSSVLCHDGAHCVEKNKFCDNVKDCSDDSDELFCGKQNCTSEEFPCFDGEQCVPRPQICDHANDCYDGSDEDVCEPSERCSLQHNRYLCSSEQQCIDITRTCNNFSDCDDRSDEGGKCDEAKSSCKQGLCGHTCIPTPDGPHCLCNEGFLLQNYTCKDINECEDNLCSQGCINVPGTYSCSCQAGYTLQTNGSCQADGPDPVLYVASYHQILSYNLRSRKEMAPVVKDLSGIQNIAMGGNHLYWTGSNAVYMYDLEGHRKPLVVIDTGIDSLGGIAVDTITSHLYIVDSSKNRIVVCNSYGDVCTVILEDLDGPKDVILYKDRKLIWSEIGKHPSIKRSEMNGQKEDILISDNMQSPQCLAVDEPVDRLYWIDSVLDRIESVHLDGTGRKIIFSRNIKHPFGIAVFEDTMYWADEEHSSIMSADKVTGRRLLPLATDIKHVTSIIINHPVLYHSGKPGNPCWLQTHQCTDICLPSGASYSCGCPFHKKLDTNNTTCVDDLDRCGYLLIGGNGAILQYPLCGIGKQDLLTSDIVIDSMKTVSVIGQYKSSILYRDLSRGVIAMVNLDSDNDSRSERILYRNLHTVTDVSVDWNSGVIFWTDPLKSIVQAGSLNGSLITTVVKKGLQRPNSITVDPIGEYIYFSDVGENPRLWYCYMDGSHCNTMSVKISHVNDMVFDHDTKRLYYTEEGDHSIKAISVQDQFHVETVYRAKTGDNPFYLALYGEYLYWTDLNKRSKVMSMKTTNTKEIETINLPQMGVPNGLFVALTSVPHHNVCSKSNGGCMHFCFSTPAGQSCKCQDSWKLNDDLKTCLETKCDKPDCERNVTLTTEKTPTVTTPPTCTKFKCNDGGCIDLKYVCDNHPDCYDESDESNCNHSNIGQGSIKTNMSCDPAIYYKCESGECIPLNKACIRTLSCIKSADEIRMCAIACEDSDCIQNCYPTPRGPICYCNQGYQLSDVNSKECIDINECATHNGNCSQVCLNRNGSHLCTCTEGYTASQNGTLCTAQVAKPSFVLGGLRDGIFLLDEFHQRIDLDLGNTSQGVTTLDVNMKSRDIYFYTKKNGIQKFSGKTKSTHTLFMELNYVTHIAYDWVGENLYVSDTRMKKLLVCNVKVIPLQCKTLMYGEKWRDLVLHPEKGIMFMSSFESKQIQKLCMNGKHRHVVVETDLSMPSGLAIDIPANRIYWLDVDLGSVESANLDGKDRYTVYRETTQYQFTNLDVFENDLYLTNRKLPSLVKLDKLGKKPPVTIYKGINIMSDVKVFHPLLQKHDRNICKTLKCVHLCLLTLDTAVCACYDGYLINNMSQCIDMKAQSTDHRTEEVHHSGNQITPEIIQLADSTIAKPQQTTDTPKPSFNSIIIPHTTMTGIYKISTDHHKDLSCYLHCQNNGKCVNSEKESKCICKPGFSGKLCELEPERMFQSYSWIIGVGLVLIALVLAVITIYLIKLKRNGYHYIPCRRSTDDAEDLVTEMTFRGPVTGNPVFQEFEDINYPPECSCTDLNLSCQSVDSAFVSKRDDSDSQSSQTSETGSVGHHGYMKI